MDEYLQLYPGSGRFIYSHFTLYDAALDDSVPTNETIIVTRHRNLDLTPYYYFDRKRGFFVVDWERFAVDWELADGRAAAMMVLRGLHQEIKWRYKDWERARTARTARMVRTANRAPAELTVAAFWRRIAQMEEERDW